MRTVFLVPRRDGDVYRDRVWAWVRAWWERNHPDWPVVEGHHTEGPFNRSAAINTAAETAGDWDLAIIADSDSIVDPARLVEAVERAQATGRFTVAFELRAHIRQDRSAEILDGYVGPWGDGVADWLPNHHSGMIVVTRALWDAVGGFDPGFESPGAEDEAFALPAIDLGGGCERIAGVLWHLWHPIRQEPTPQIHERLERYRAVHDRGGNADEYRALRDDLRART